MGWRDMDIIDGSGFWSVTSGGAPPPPAPAPVVSGGGGRLDESPFWEVPVKQDIEDDDLLILLH